ncbi:MAG: efflux RND transporter periplasmic adaptor subunit [Terriglobia bacterium]|jgi:multidrug efflux system membrane fusion protein
MDYSGSCAGTTFSGMVVPAETGNQFAHLCRTAVHTIDALFQGYDHAPRAVARVVAGLGLGLSLFLWTGCSAKKAETQGLPPDYSAPVTTGTATLATVPVQVHAIGNVEAYATVSVKAQVAARIEKASFTEGKDVRRGDLLFTLDRQPFDVALQQAEANLAKDQAQLENAGAESDRYKELFQEGIVSKEQYDSMRTNADALAASARADKAAIDKARIDLSYCAIQSPIDGRTGAVLVHPGNLVKDNDAALVVLNQIHPIYVTFSVPEQHLADIKRFQAEAPLRVEASAPNQEQAVSTGVLSFIDNTVDSTTGTIKLKATFQNPDNRLWPGQFVNVALTLVTQAHAVVVPSQAVQTGQAGQYVFVVKQDMTAEYRPVVAGNSIAGKTVIQKGVAVGETLITDGQMRVVPSMKVAIRKQ